MATWHDIIGPLKEQAYFKQALDYVAQCRARGEIIYPCDAQIFNAFRLTPFARVKVVILGQDPYHEPGQAMGLSFSVPLGIAPPPSLQNIYRELQQSVPGFAIPDHGCLIPWARQGVLLLNAVLTVRQGAAGSHHHRGWEEFTDGVLEALNASCEHLVFMLWGSVARRKGAALDRRRHLVLESSHPSPLSAYRGFLGCGHFPKANAYLTAHALTPINWQLPVYTADCREL